MAQAPPIPTPSDAKQSLTERIRSEHKIPDDLKPLPKTASVPRGREVVTLLGKSAQEAWIDVLAIVTFGGHAANATFFAIIRPRYLRLPSASLPIAPPG